MVETQSGISIMDPIVLFAEPGGFHDLLAYYLRRKGFPVTHVPPSHSSEWSGIRNVNVLVLTGEDYRRYSDSFLKKLQAANPDFRMILLYDMEESGSFRDLEDPRIFGYFEKPLLRYRHMFLLTVRNAWEHATLKSRLRAAPMGNALPAHQPG